jgi:small subunit ribosomal protein S7
MFAQLRSAASRSLWRQGSRTLTTAPAESSTDALLRSAFGSLGAAPVVAASSETPAVAARTAARSNVPPVLDIPPAEDPLLAYLASALTAKGKRAQASRIVARTMRYLHALTRAPPLPVIRAAVEAAAPAVRTTSTRIGAKVHFRPIALGEKQRTRFAVQWILAASEGKPGKTVEERLAREIIAVLQGASSALKKKEEIHKFAMVNR